MSSHTDDAVTEIQHAAYHTSAFEAVGASIMSFQPVNQIHQHLCGLHTYAVEPSRAVRAHHFCTHLRKDLHQCIIYDSDRSDARLIGIEYVIPEDTFERLPTEERKYWHSHKYEVDSGMLQLGTKSLVPNQVDALAERPAMLELHRTYGKTIHTWAFDTEPELPLGPPHLMMSYTSEAQVDKALLRSRDEALGVSTEAKRESRRSYLRAEDLERPPAEGCDQWLGEKRGRWVWEEL
ncbi:hypothetical protein BCR39DRAFT_528835 [Naematelia encephala]|uniref:DUF1264-domain-containing protein n=1 Tax=Naematelia encephala TaxID=71784 RepID=A0A1Y2B7Q5_9TREE|nr:hypothetical protein BCR39DRAFT_528835 [Naematelia encephala]